LRNGASPLVLPARPDRPAVTALSM